MRVGDAKRLRRSRVHCMIHVPTGPHRNRPAISWPWKCGGRVVGAGCETTEAVREILVTGGLLFILTVAAAVRKGMVKSLDDEGVGPPDCL